MQLRNTASQKLFLKQSEFQDPRNSATLLKKIYVRIWALAEKLRRWLQLRNTAFYIFFLITLVPVSMQQCNTALKKYLSDLEP